MEKRIKGRNHEKKSEEEEAERKVYEEIYFGLLRLKT